MPNEDNRATAPSTKGPAAFRYTWIIIAMLLVVGLAIAAMLVSKDDQTAKAAGGSALDQPLTSASPSTNTIDEQTELVTRLREILAARERAYDKRNPELLKEVYTVDCPCLESDSNAIRELISSNYVWVGGETSIRVRRTERVTPRMWIVIADFFSQPLRIETRSGGLIRSEPRGRDLFQFVLAKPKGSTQWLLGRASSYKDG